MKNKTPHLLALSGLLLTGAFGCKTAVNFQGSLATPRATVTGQVSATTNSLTVGGDYQTGTTNLGGSVTVTK